MQEYFKKLAFAIVAETILSYEASEDDCYFTVLCEKLFLSHDSKAVILLSLFPFLKYLPFTATTERKQAIKEAEKFVWKVYENSYLEFLWLSSQRTHNINWKYETPLYGAYDCRRISYTEAATGGAL